MNPILTGPEASMLVMMAAVSGRISKLLHQPPRVSRVLSICGNTSSNILCIVLFLFFYSIIPLYITYSSFLWKMILLAMSAGLSAFFSLPLGGAIFVLEVRRFFLLRLL